jgi:zinc protease
VREKRGLTYGIGYSYHRRLRLRADMILGQVASANDRGGRRPSTLIRDEWAAHVADKGITEEELASIKTYLTGAYPLRFDGNGPIARIMVGMQMQGLPIDYINTRNDKVNAVTMEDIQRVAKQALSTPKRIASSSLSASLRGLLPTELIGFVSRCSNRRRPC